MARSKLQPAIVDPKRSGSDAVRVAGHELRIFAQTAPLIEAMVEDIRAARTRVWLESYIIAADAAGHAVAEALKERAAAGLDCRVIYDAVGCALTPAVYFQDLARAGVQVHGFHSLGQALWHFASLRILNRRTHRKLLVIDDRVAYFGGMNVVDQSGARGRTLPAAIPDSAGWRDVHVRMVGPQQSEVAEAFDGLWRRTHHLRPLRSRPWRMRALLRTKADWIAFFDCRPSYKQRRASRVFVPLIRTARRSITLSMAYFIPQGRILRALLKARRRGVKIRVIVPGQSDVPAVRWATRHLYRRLLRQGVQIYESKSEMLHSKVTIVDGHRTAIGSCNIDVRSLLLNLEFLGVIQSKAMAQAMATVTSYEMRNSRRVRIEHVDGRGWWQRWLDRLAWSFRRWL